MIDCHLHYTYENETQLKDIVQNSKYCNKYMLYSQISYKSLDITKNIYDDEKVFLMPFILKETNIKESNIKLFQFAKQFKDKVYCLPLIGEKAIAFKKNIIGMKEHFLLHNAFDSYKRHKYYNYLNRYGKVLLLHCHDDVRLQYIKYLRYKYPNMIIIIPHLGVNRKRPELTKQIFDTFRNDTNVYFDLSTIFDEGLIKMALNSLQISHILFGSDLPYGDKELSIEKYFNKYSKLFDEEEKKKIYHDNAIKLLKIVLKNEATSL